MPRERKAAAAREAEGIHLERVREFQTEKPQAEKNEHLKWTIEFTLEVDNT